MIRERLLTASLLLLAATRLGAAEAEAMIETEGAASAKEDPTAVYVPLFNINHRPPRDERLADLRARANALRWETCPELALTERAEFTEEEWRRYSTAALALPLSDRNTLILRGERLDFTYDPRDPETPEAHAILTDLRLQLRHRLNDHHTLWGEAEAFHGGDDGSGGGAVGWIYRPLAELRLDAELRYNRPWLESTTAIDADGREDLALLGVTLPLPGPLTLRLEGERRRARVGEEAIRLDEGGEIGAAGDGSRLTGRLEIPLWSQPSAYMGGMFLDEDALEPQGITPGASLYLAAEERRFKAREGFVAVPTTPHAMDFRAGLLYTLRITPLAALSLEGYLGQDHARGIAWNRLYGGRARLTLLAGPLARLYAESSVDADSGDAVGGGRQESFTLGFNWNF